MQRGAPCWPHQGARPAHFAGKGGGGPQRAPPNWVPGKHGKKLFVGGIPQTVDAGAMKAYFLKFGDISDCVVLKDGAGRHRGFGFVQFSRKEGAVRCLQGGPHVLDGRYVEVKPTDREDQKQAPKPASESPPRRSRSRSSPSIFRKRKGQRSRSRSKSRGRSRSKSRSRSRSKSRSKSRGRSKTASSEEDEEELDILDVRADQRRAQAGAISNIDDLPVQREPADLPEAVSSWADAAARRYIGQDLVGRLQGAGLERPTLIQRHAIPVISHELGRYDLIASAQTGSGKTFAFVIPLAARLLLHGCAARPFFPGDAAQASPLILLLSPTRELAVQTSKEVEVLSRGSSLSNFVVYGGESMKLQIQRIAKGQVDILCATPGRLIDMIDAGKLSLSFVQTVVLDEADQMLEQGLEIMCAEILTGRDMPPPSSGRQTLLFSATMPQKIREMVPQILRESNIANLTIGHYQDDKGGSCASIRQIVKWVPDEQERCQVLFRDLQALRRPGGGGKVVIFTNRRLQASQLAGGLNKQGISCSHLHGKLEQAVREEVVDKFRRGHCEVLVATNVMARGLDFPGIELVVQFDLPASIEIYTHRIGRTGRVGQLGCALAYMGPKDRQLGEKLAEFLELNQQEVPEFLRARRGWGGKGGKGSFGGKAGKGAGYGPPSGYGRRDAGRRRSRSR